MRLVLHPKVYSDIDKIVGYYRRVATSGLGKEFYTKLRYFVTNAADKPQSFSIRERDIWRANLRRFPYHFLFRGVGHEAEFSSSAITIHIHLLDPDVDRSMAEFEEYRLECSWILVGTSGGGGRNSESVKAS
jgi:hypothetical protein